MKYRITLYGLVIIALVLIWIPESFYNNMIFSFVSFILFFVLALLFIVYSNSERMKVIIHPSSSLFINSLSEYSHSDKLSIFLPSQLNMVFLFVLMLGSALINFDVFDIPNKIINGVWFSWGIWFFASHFANIHKVSNKDF